MAEQITTTTDVISALGGTQAIQDLLGVGQQAISHWRTQNRFPPHTFVTVQAALMKRGLSADVSLWRWERKRKAVGE